MSEIPVICMVEFRLTENSVSKMLLYFQMLLKIYLYQERKTARITVSVNIQLQFHL